MKLTFLGTGTSFGVPQLGCDCDVCRSSDSRDKRTRVGAFVETDGGARLLIDTPPELRLQLIANHISTIDAVLYTHDHADHTHGIDDLRPVSNRLGGALDMYGPRYTLDRLRERFGYIFDNSLKVLPGTSKPKGHAVPLEPYQSVQIGDATITPVVVPHGYLDVFGYRINDLAYVTDAKTVPDRAIEALKGSRVLVINALFRKEHPSHLSISEAIEVARKVGAERTFLTHLTHDNSHATLEAELPQDVRPAFDGLTVTL